MILLSNFLIVTLININSRLDILIVYHQIIIIFKVIYK